MNTKRLLIGMAVLMAFTLTWNPLWDWIAKKNHWKTRTEEQKAAQTTPTAPVIPATGPATMPSTLATSGPTSGPTTGSTMGAAPAVGPDFGPGTAATIGSPEYDEKGQKSDYPLAVKVTSFGAGIEAVDLNRYKRTVDVKESYAFQKPYTPGSEYGTSLATRSISINGGAPIALTGNWKLIAPTTQSTEAIQSSAAFSLDVTDAAGDKLTITKTYTIHTTKEKDKGSGYEVNVAYTFTNLGDKPIKVKTAFNGPTAPVAENNRDTTNVVMGYDDHSTIRFDFKAATSLKAEASDLKSDKGYGFLWTGFSSNYFDAIVRPVDSSGKPLSLASVTGHDLLPNAKEATDRQGVIAMETADIAIDAGKSESFTLDVFVGPKLRALLNDDHYSNFPRAYDNTLVMTSKYCGFCTWPWLINLLVGLLNGLHWLFGGDWGLAIIGLVVIVRVLLHPVTKRSQVSMSRMTKMGPAMEKLKKKYADDKEGFAKAQMQLYKEQGIAPLLGCLPMFLQMPIWIALWTALQSTFEIRHAPFLWGFTWIKDLSQPDRLISLKETVGFWVFSVSALNLLPILMGAIFYLQQKFMPQPMAMSPEQAQQQKMMKWMMPFMMPIFLYGSPSGLNLYILTSTALGIIESKRVRDHIKQEDERANAGLVIVDGPSDDDTGPTGVRRGPGKPPEQPKASGFIGRLMERAQKMAEDAQKQAKSQQIQKRKKK